ncbi:MULTISPECIES: aminoacyl-tRNA hydrolase [Aerococcus]|uniref:Peptidyl-tRNA hydrolase n=2 Tax=Aerococcus TaxID=1375 RepID=A0A178HDV6_9LACT|nr:MULTISPECIES: aminoacyl-tRNA hydrolase [Aerococcus]KAA9218952.1 aminoacyl-tRNA hydrolase [Aerococcus loyolae]KAA9266060.1 aminoacyl-tRNA hydrolase [Aerococcus loyolae]MCY3025831.1 aminoacyl-tRNA hydrolase [Aerococcus loyolae]MCY3027682.1 aminoacyl-tRNA hydrolase [Aerococcus loyolae]MCY3029725.1 aminoacyl-tRNA hydrolase [Aerococcus loyolae]
MKLVVGLGNPGKEYEGTRHNIGFIVLNEWAYRHHESFDRSAFNGVYFKRRVANDQVIFVKPTTFMNLSGQCVSGFMNYYHIDLEDLLVVYDDMDMEPGRLRLRKKGSAGGHNGMKDIIKMLNSKDIQRIKLGVGHPQGKGSVVNHVLGKFSKEDQGKMLESSQAAADAISYWLEGNSFENTMNRFNN